MVNPYRQNSIERVINGTLRILRALAVGEDVDYHDIQIALEEWEALKPHVMKAWDAAKGP